MTHLAPGWRLRLLALLLMLAPLMAAAAVSAGMPASVPARLQQLLATGRQGQLPGVDIDQWALLEQLYQGRDGALIWSDPDGQPRRQRQQQLAAWIVLSHDQGLDPQDYGYERLQLAEGGTSLSSEPLLNDLLMSHAFMQLALDLSGSRPQLQQLDPLWRLPTPRLDPVALLAQLDQGHTVDELLQALLPQAEEYRRLVELHAELRVQARQPQQVIALPERLLRRGDQDPGVVLLRQWLSRAGWLDAAASSLEDETRYSALLAAAVQAFQRAHALDADGIYGPATRAAMLAGPAQQLRQLRLNLLRWRALPRPLGERYLLVRTASFNLDLIEQGRLRQRHAVITGRPSRPSLSFAAEVDRLILNPPWTVPFRIAVEDLLPKQQQDPGHFDRLGIEVLAQGADGWQPVPSATVDWHSLSRQHFPYLLRQRPGPHNSLGQIRFGMANPYSIFLHDTPQQGLFASASRAFSSGCIRVQGIAELAQTLLGERPLATELSDGYTRQLRLPASLPVYLVYLTVWVDDARQAHFVPDLYGLDARLAQALEPVDVTPDATSMQLAQTLLKK